MPRTTLLAIVSALSLTGAPSPLIAQSAAPVQPGAPASDNQWSEPPGPITDAERALLAQAAQVMKAEGVSAALTDARFDTLHPRPEFREAVREHATPSPLTLASDSEPGERLILTCTVTDNRGAPIPNALVYLYQTSAKGWYAADGAHVRAQSGDHRHARLFGYVRTDAHGAFEVRSVRPAGYPRSTLPQHFHVWVEAPGFRTLGTELLFDDDPRLTPEVRRESERNGFVIAKPTRDASGVWQAAYNLVAQRE